MREFDEKIRELWQKTQPVLTSYEREEIRIGVWDRVRRHRRALVLRTAIASAAVVVLAVMIALNPFGGNAPKIDESSYYLALSDEAIVEQLADTPDSILYSAFFGDDIDSIAAAVLYYEVNISIALEKLTPQEQEEILLALAE